MDSGAETTTTSSVEGRYGSDHEILDGIVEYLRAEHGLTAEFTSNTAGCRFCTIGIGKSHDLILEVRSGFLLVEEYAYVRGHSPIKLSYELSNPAEFDKAIKTILELVEDKRGGFYHV